MTKPDLMAELAACPFCGGKAQVRIPTERDGFAAHVSCHCGAQLYGHKRHFADEQEAIAAWNTRTHHAELEAVVRDAARYRYLRDSGDDSIYVMRFDVEGDTPISGKEVDESIDAMHNSAREG